MAADFNKPVVTDAYASVLQSIRDLAKDLALCLDNTGTQNIPTNAIRWSSANNRFEKYNGATWAALTSRYAIDVATVGGKSVGNASGNVPLSNGTLNTNLNAEMVGGSTLSKIFQADWLSGQNPGDANSAIVRGASAHFIAGANKPAGTDHALLSLAHSTAWAVQMAGDWRTNEWYVRNLNNGTWAGWNKLYHTGNFTPNATAQNNIGAAGTYGAVTFLNNVGSWAGFRFGTGVGSDNRYLMTNGGQTGEYDSGAGAWKWRWDNGTLAYGTVPWARLSGVPSFNYLPSTGGQISGGLQVTGEAHIGYGQNASRLYFGDADESTGGPKSIYANSNVIGILNGTGSSWLMHVNNAGQIYSANYGWLHDYFTRTVNAGSQLTGGGSGPNLTISHASVGYTGAGINAPAIMNFNNGHMTNCNCNCNCCGG